MFKMSTARSSIQGIVLKSSDDSDNGPLIVFFSTRPF